MKIKEKLKLMLLIIAFLIAFGIVGSWDMECRQVQLGGVGKEMR